MHVYTEVDSGEAKPVRRPDCTSLDWMEIVDDQIAELESQIKQLSEWKRDLVSQIATETDPDEYISVMHYLYFAVTEVPTSLIESSFGFNGGTRLYTVVGPAELDIHCESCGDRLAVKSRSDLQRFQTDVRKVLKRREKGDDNASDDLILCRTCFKKTREISPEMLERIRQREQRKNELRTMPYREYLQTPEWKERRYQHLKSVGFLCQICNHDGRLDIHHRTYENRGDERRQDLIALCRDCHDLFHSEGKLDEQLTQLEG